MRSKSMHYHCLVACVACFLLAHVSEAQYGQWNSGRTTFYGDHWDAAKLSMGSCEYGYLDPNKCTGRDIAALSDQHPEFNWADKSCGRCFEVKCVNSWLTDGYGASIDRRSACYDPGASVVVQVTDMCPCHYPNNAYSNKRWCCGDDRHMDLSVFAWEKLAPKTLGVIKMKYRRVPCDYRPARPARLPNGVSATPPNEYPPWGWTGDKRPCPKGTKPTINRNRNVRRRSAVRSRAPKARSNMSYGTWSFSRWNSRGINGGNAAVCGTVYSWGGVTLNGKFSGKRAIEFWVRREGGSLPPLKVTAHGKGKCRTFNIKSMARSGERNGYVKYWMPLARFKCKKVNKLILQNTASWGSQSLCVDAAVLHS